MKIGFDTYLKVLNNYNTYGAFNEFNDKKFKR